MSGYKGDINTTIEVPSGADLTDAAVLRIKYTKPDRTIGHWTATPSGTSAIYVTEQGDLDVAGWWKIELFVSWSSGWEGHGSIGQFLINEPLFS